MLQGIAQLVVYVDDMEVQADFYMNTLGLEVIKPATSDDFGKEQFLKFATGTCSVVLHRNRYGYKRGSDEMNRPKFIFQVDDVEKARDVLEQRGVPMEPIREAAPGLLIIDCHDPEGNPFAVMSESALSS